METFANKLIFICFLMVGWFALTVGSWLDGCCCEVDATGLTNDVVDVEGSTAWEAEFKLGLAVFYKTENLVL